MRLIRARYTILEIVLKRKINCFGHWLLEAMVEEERRRRCMKLFANIKEDKSSAKTKIWSLMDSSSLPLNDLLLLTER